MSNSSRITLAIAALALGLMYLFPLWSITLEAPQYPEGIGMYIQINNVTGHKAHDLDNINGLNHYIGMKTIEPDTIAELKIMPWIIAFLMVLGLASAAMGRRWMLYTWAGLFLVIAVVGLVDFYLWEYDYGHNLDPTAAIQVPGMTYQPPLIGAKKLLNFTAHSWPALGGWAAFASLATGLVLAFVERRSARRQRPLAKIHRPADVKQMAVAASVVMLLGLTACTPEPRPLAHGSDHCDHCMMSLSDERYGAELVTKKGKVYVFDSIECLAAHQLDESIAEDDVHSLWVVDFQAPPNLVTVDDAFFLHSRDLRSPMGLNLTSFGPDITQQAVEHAFYGEILDWDGVLGLVQANRMNDAPGADSMQPTRHSMPSQP